jgi:HK97 family phage portal protein
VDFFETTDTSSGVSVTEGSALRLIAVYACIRVISEDVGKLPLIPYRRLERGKERIEGRLFSLLHDSANPEMCACTFRETVTGWALRTGNGLAEVVKDNAGRAVEMWPLETNRARWEALPDGRVVYEVDNRRVDSDTILHIRGVGGDGITGWSPIKIAREAIGAALGAERFGAGFFANNAAGGGYLKHPGTLTDNALKRLSASFDQQYAGAANAYKTKILEEGMDFQANSIPPDDAQFIETKQFSVEEIARLYRVPPHKIQHLLRSTFSNIEFQALEYVTDTLMPWLVRWEQEINRVVISPAMRRGGVFAEHLVQGLLRGDMKARSEFYGKMFSIGALSQNDIRQLENLNAIGAAGEVYYVPLNMAPSSPEGPAVPEPDPPPAEDEPEDGDGEDGAEEESEDNRAMMLTRIIDAHVELVEDCLTRIGRIEEDRIRSHRSQAGYPAWLAEFKAAHVPHVRAAIGGAIDAAARSMWPLISANGDEPDMARVMEVTAQAATRHCDGLPRGPGGSWTPTWGTVADEARAILAELAEDLNQAAGGPFVSFTPPIVNTATGRGAE